MIALVVS
ncbi:hypothetical protein YPPY08_3511, partial [Yersinia pestis PY-08]